MRVCMKDSPVLDSVTGPAGVMSSKIGFPMWAANLVQSLVLAGGQLMAAGTGKRSAGAKRADHPRLADGVELRDIVFRSRALDRTMPYRVFLPAEIEPDRKLPVVYLLHGQDGHFTDWSNKTDVAQYAARGLVLVMPQGDSSYYSNWVSKKKNAYENYLVDDLIAEVESRFPALRTRAGRTIVGVSMGGFGAVRLALTRPDLFCFVGGISSAVDVPSRPFNWKHIGQSLLFRSIFGPAGSLRRRRHDPFLLARTANPAAISYLYLTACDPERLLEPNRRFAALLAELSFAHEFHILPGRHNWEDWAEQIGGVFECLIARLRIAQSQNQSL